MLNEKGLAMVHDFVKSVRSYSNLLTMMIEWDNLRKQMTCYLTAQPAAA